MRTMKKIRGKGQVGNKYRKQYKWYSKREEAPDATKEYLETTEVKANYRFTYYYQMHIGQQ
jgi:hypothetical protein